MLAHACDFRMHTLLHAALLLDMPCSVLPNLGALANSNACAHHVSANYWNCGSESISPLREIQSHVAERFWYIHMSYQAPGASGGGRCSFEWRRGRLFDHVAATVLYEVCCEDPTATILRVRSSAVTPLLFTSCCSTVRVHVLHARNRRQSTYFSEQLSALF